MFLEVLFAMQQYCGKIYIVVFHNIVDIGVIVMKIDLFLIFGLLVLTGCVQTEQSIYPALMEGDTVAVSFEPDLVEFFINKSSIPNQVVYQEEVNFTAVKVKNEGSKAISIGLCFANDFTIPEMGFPMSGGSTRLGSGETGELFLRPKFTSALRNGMINLNKFEEGDYFRVGYITYGNVDPFDHCKSDFRESIKVKITIY